MPLLAPAAVAGAAGVAGAAAELIAEACTRAAKTRDWLKTRWALGLRQELKRWHNVNHNGAPQPPSLSSRARGAARTPMGLPEEAKLPSRSATKWPVSTSC